jgi:tetratricopeptide (TPR) repeat protein
MEDFNKGEYGEAIENFEHAIRMRPDYVEAYFYLGQSYEKVQRVEHAERAYGNAISYDPHYLPAREALGLIEFDHKEYREAEKQLDTARSLGSTNPNVFYAIGRIDLSERECRKAIQAFKEAVRLDRDFHEAWEWLEKAEDMCGRGSGEGVHTEKSFKGGGRAISPDNF